MNKSFFISIFIILFSILNAQEKNNITNLVKGKIGLGVFFDNFYFDENGNMIEISEFSKNTYYFLGSKSSNEFYFYNTETRYNEFDEEVIVTNYTGFIISNNIVLQMSSYDYIDFGYDYVHSIEELNNRYKEKGAYPVGILFDKNEFQNIINNPYKYEDFFGTFEYEDNSGYIILSKPKNNFNNYYEYDEGSMTYEFYDLNIISIKNNKPMTNLSLNYEGGYSGIQYDKNLIYYSLDSTELDSFLIITIINKDTLFINSGSIYDPTEKSYEFGYIKSGILKRKKSN